MLQIEYSRSFTEHAPFFGVPPTTCVFFVRTCWEDFLLYKQSTQGQILGSAPACHSCLGAYSWAKVGASQQIVVTIKRFWRNCLSTRMVHPTNLRKWGWREAKQMPKNKRENHHNLLSSSTQKNSEPKSGINLSFTPIVFPKYEWIPSHAFGNPETPKKWHNFALKKKYWI